MNNITFFRQEKQISQQELSAWANVKRYKLSLVEQDENYTALSVDEEYRICKVLGVEHSRLFPDEKKLILLNKLQEATKAIYKNMREKQRGTKQCQEIQNNVDA